MAMCTGHLYKIRLEMKKNQQKYEKDRQNVVSAFQIKTFFPLHPATDTNLIETSNFHIQSQTLRDIVPHT